MLGPAVKLAQALVSDFDNEGGATAWTGGMQCYALGSLLFWLICSFGMVIFNKWIYDSGEKTFPFPLLLTTLHMIATFTGTLLICFLRSIGWFGFGARVQWRALLPPRIDFVTFGGRIAITSVFYAISLSSANQAYLYLSVPYIQMTKASMPVLTLLLMIQVGLEHYNWQYLKIVMVISIGVMVYLTCLIATKGKKDDLRFHSTGFILQSIAILSDCIRLTYLNLLLGRPKKRSVGSVETGDSGVEGATQRVVTRGGGGSGSGGSEREGSDAGAAVSRAGAEGAEVETALLSGAGALPALLIVSPVAAAILGCCFLLFEYPRLQWADVTGIGLGVLGCNCAWAFVLNLSVFVLVRETSALVLTLGGVIKVPICPVAQSPIRPFAHIHPHTPAYTHDHMHPHLST
jgi:hypothetical protein